MKNQYIIPVIEVTEQWLEADILGESNNYYGDSGSAGGDLEDGLTYNF